MMRRGITVRSRRVSMSPLKQDPTPPHHLSPTSLSGTAVSSSQINLSWTASTDNVGVTGYKIYRNGTQVGTSATNSYSDTGLTASTAYTYTVSAYDAAGNNSAQSTSINTMTLASSTSSTCPFASAGFADGCSGAAAGTPQDTTLLQQYGANRPPWNVAGVDYAVGAVGPFKDPSVSGNLPACASYSAGSQNTVTINSAPCTLASLDFSLHGGICLNMNSAISNNGLVTITNNNFSAGPNCQPLGGGVVNIAGDVTVMFTYNTVNGQYSNQLQSTVQHQGAEPGNETFEYNYLINNPQHVFHLDGSGTFTIKYNFGNGIGLSPDHGDWLYQPGNPAGVVINEAFNTVYSSPSGCCTNGVLLHVHQQRALYRVL